MLKYLKKLKGRNLWYVVGVVVVAAGVIWVLSGRTLDVPGEPAEQSGGKATPAPGGGTTLPQSYLEAAAYHDSKGTRFQFDQYCQAIPKESSVKNGSTIMLDNRSGDARTISVGGVAYNLAGYGWRIVRASAPTVPTKIYFNCGSAVNVGTINLQP